MTTNANQFDVLVFFMERNEGIAKNYLNAPQYKETTNKLWEDLTKKLHDAGPPTKTVSGWKKVWKDYKYSVKAKIRANKKNISGTSGGPYKIKRINPTEERLDKLLDITGDIEGINAEEFGCTILTHNTNGMPNLAEAPTIKVEEFIMNIDEVDEIRMNVEADNAQTVPRTETTTQQPRTVTTKRNSKETVKMLLKKQIQIQETYYTSCEEFRKKKTFKETLNFNKEKWLAKQKLLIQRSKHKAEQLEVQKLELELKQDLRNSNI